MQKAVRLVGAGVPYSDGAEAELLELMTNAEDRTVGSDELASKIHDWATMYHLSSARCNLLMPFNIQAGMRVLDVGCGTGALTRQFAEWGCEVIGIEGSYDRALVAAQRVREFENAEIASGSLEEYVKEGHAEEFDVVVLCGVLEYSGAIYGGSDGHGKMLSSIRSILKPNGIAIIAIENQLGMKYLLGYNEDHLGTPWLGLSDYFLDNSGIRTWTRSGLQDILSQNGFLHTKWFGAFPDYKLPTSIISDDLWSHPDGKQLAKQFVRNPISDQSSEPQFKSDPMKFWELMLQTSSPEDFVNSHLVVAGRQELEKSEFLKPDLIWNAHGTRRKKYATKNVLSLDESGKNLILKVEAPQPSLSGNLSFNRKTSEVLVGENMEDWLVENLRGKNLTESIPVFRNWWDRAQVEIENSNDDGTQFDVLPRNFIRDSDGVWNFIDDEWRWKESIDRETILLRSLMVLSIERLNALSLPKITEPISFKEAILAVASALEPATTEHHFSALIELEMEIGSRVFGGDYSEGSIHFDELFEKKLSDLHNPRKSLDIKLALHEARVQVNVAQSEVIGLRRMIDDLKSSLSWRISFPVRLLGRVGKKLVN